MYIKSFPTVLMLQNQVQKDSVCQDGSKDQAGKTAQFLDNQNNLFFLCAPLMLLAEPLHFLCPVWFLELDWGPGGDQQRRRELFQRSMQRVKEIKARRALEKSRLNDHATSEAKQPYKVKQRPPVPATCEVKLEPHKLRPDVQSKSSPAERSSSSRQKKVQPANEGIESF